MPRPEASWLFASLGFGRHLVFHATVGLASCRTTRTGETLETQGEAHVVVYRRFWAVSWADGFGFKKRRWTISRKMEIDGFEKDREDGFTQDVCYFFNGYDSYMTFLSMKFSWYIRWNYMVVFRFGFQVLYIVFSLKGPRVPKYRKDPGDINEVMKLRRCSCHFYIFYPELNALIFPFMVSKPATNSLPSMELTYIPPIGKGDNRNLIIKTALGFGDILVSGRVPSSSLVFPVAKKRLP